MSEIRLMLLGDSGIGKSSLVTRFCRDVVSEQYTPTTFDYNSSFTVLDGQAFFLSIAELSGSRQGNFEAKMREISLTWPDVFVVCFSLASAESLRSACRVWAPELRQLRPGVPIVFAGLQADRRAENMPSAFVTSVAFQAGASRLVEVSAFGDWVGVSSLFRQAASFSLTAAISQPPSRRRCHDQRGTVLFNLFRRLFRCRPS
jgi:small GTP-binding protein